MSLCYEVHGDTHNDKFYNIITSKCVSVNVHYSTKKKSRNIIDQIGIQAVDNEFPTMQTRRIGIFVDGCFATVDDIKVTTYNRLGIQVQSIKQAVLVTMPNCDDKLLEMRIDCQTEPRNMLRFEVTRGLNFGHNSSHGLLGKI